MGTNSAENDLGYSEEMIDILSDELLRFIGPVLTDPMLRTLVLADAYAKDLVSNRYNGDPFETMDESESLVGEMVAGHIIDSDPSLYSDFAETMNARGNNGTWCNEDEYDDDPDGSDDGGFDDEDCDYDGDDVSNNQFGCGHRCGHGGRCGCSPDSIREICDPTVCGGDCGTCRYSFGTIRRFVFDGTSVIVVEVPRDLDD